jgi:uncharacterized DUF497 family protein
MQFQWDAAKADLVYRSRRIAFEDIAELFEKPHVVIASSKMEEERWRIVGDICGACVTGVFTRRGYNIRIITARRAWRAEEREYRSLYA